MNPVNVPVSAILVVEAANLAGFHAALCQPQEIRQHPRPSLHTLLARAGYTAMVCGWGQITPELWTECHTSQALLVSIPSAVWDEAVRERLGRYTSGVGLFEDADSPPGNPAGPGLIVTGPTVRWGRLLRALEAGTLPPIANGSELDVRLDGWPGIGTDSARIVTDRDADLSVEVVAIPGPAESQPPLLISSGGIPRLLISAPQLGDRLDSFLEGYDVVVLPTVETRWDETFEPETSGRIGTIDVLAHRAPSGRIGYRLTHEPSGACIAIVPDGADGAPDVESQPWAAATNLTVEVGAHVVSAIGHGGGLFTRRVLGPTQSIGVTMARENRTPELR